MDQTGTTTIDTARISEFLGAFPAEFTRLGEQEQLLSATIYRLMAESARPVPLPELAASLKISTGQVQEILASWTGLYYDDQSAIAGYWGLATSRRPHRFVVAGRTLYTWCAWDSLFIPQIIEKTAQVESQDPVSKEIIRLTVSPGGVEQVEPAGTVVSFLLPDTDSIRADVIKSFCHYLHFFASIASAEDWIAGSDKQSDLLILSVEDAFRIGIEKNQLQYRDHPAISSTVEMG